METCNISIRFDESTSSFTIRFDEGILTQLSGLIRDLPIMILYLITELLILLLVITIIKKQTDTKTRNLKLLTLKFNF